MRQQQRNLIVSRGYKTPSELYHYVIPRKAGAIFIFRAEILRGYEKSI
jgi:hypothetical protein